MPDTFSSREQWEQFDIRFDPNLSAPLLDFVNVTVKRLRDIYTVGQSAHSLAWEEERFNFSAETAQPILSELTPCLDEIGYTAGLSYSGLQAADFLMGSWTLPPQMALTSADSSLALLACANELMSLKAKSPTHEQLLENLATKGFLHDAITARIHLDAHKRTLSKLDRKRPAIDSVSNLSFYTGIGAGCTAALLLGNFTIAAGAIIAMFGAYGVKEHVTNRLIIDPVLAEAYPRALELSDPSTIRSDSPGGTLACAMLIALEEGQKNMPRAYRSLQLLRLLAYHRIPREELENVVHSDRFNLSTQSYPQLEKLARKYLSDHAQDPLDLEVKMIAEIGEIKDSARKLARNAIQSRLS